MIDYRHLIIDLPHLQSIRQRIGSFFVAIVCWALWIYFFIPLVSLGGWLMGVRKLSQEIRWFGGYKSLLGLMELYGETVLAIAALWLLWTLYTSLRRGKTVDRPQPVNHAQLCETFAVDPVELDQCQHSSCVTVHFDDHGHIVHMEPKR